MVYLFRRIRVVMSAHYDGEILSSRSMTLRHGSMAFPNGAEWPMGATDSLGGGTRPIVAKIGGLWSMAIEGDTAACARGNF
jgi:hypothetical protein